MKFTMTFLLIALLIVSAGESPLYGGTTGKIAGKITDGETGESLIGANVVIKGTSLGASTDLEGEYAILNIPPGIYTVTISMVGYQQAQFDNVRVSSDFTTRIDAVVKPQAVELATMVITAERKLVIKDMTSSLSTIGADQIRSLPVQSVNQVLQLNAGIVEDNGRLSIRGGRTSEVAYWVNGISTTDVYNGTVGMTVENSAVQELQVISGTFNAEYGQAMSGIVNIVTKSGGQSYTGEVKVYVGDYVSNANEFSLYKSLVMEADSTQRVSSGFGTKIISSEKENPLEKFTPIYNVEFNLGGPIPLTKEYLTFFITGRYLFDEGFFYVRDWYMPSGVPGKNELVAMNPLERFAGQGKMSLNLSSHIRLSYDLFWNKSHRERNYYNNSLSSNTGTLNLNTHDYKYNPYGLPQNFSEAFTHLFTLNHIISSSTFYDLRISRYSSEVKQYVYENPYASIKYLVNVPEDTANHIAAEVFPWNATAADSAKLQSIIAKNGTYEFIPDPNGPEGYIQGTTDGNFSTPAQYSFLNNGLDMTNLNRRTSYWTAKLDLTSQINKTNQMKFGAEARLHELEYHAFQVVPLKIGNKIAAPFQPTIPDATSMFRNDYLRNPREISVYAQDKVEFESIIFNIGLRWDYFDANASVPADPEDPNIYLPLKAANKVDVNGDGIASDNEQLDPRAIAQRRSYWYKKVDAKTSFSPRFGIAFPITDKGVIHFSYGHFFQIPEFQYLYANPDFKFSESSGNVLMGNPDLKPQSTVMYEIGLQQELAEDIGIDIALFYRDVRDWVGTSALINTARTIQYSKYENKDYENVKGITVRLDKRFSKNYSFRADYTFQSAEGTYSSPNDYYNAIQNNSSPVLMLIPMSWDQRHTFNAQMIYQVSNWTFSMIGRIWSGQPYTPTFPRGEIVTEVTGLANNSARLPAQKIVDITINKAIHVFSNLRLELFLNVYNLFDQREETAVYQDTETAKYTTTIKPSEVSYQANRVSTVEDYVIQPSWYVAPRQVQVGVIVGF